jgi:hypothetical protein
MRVTLHVIASAKPHLRLSRQPLDVEGCVRSPLSTEYLLAGRILGSLSYCLPRREIISCFSFQRPSRLGIIHHLDWTRIFKLHITTQSTMSFGFSVGDFVTVLGLAWRVYKSCKDASDDFKNISNDVAGLHIVLLETKDFITENEETLSSAGKHS